MKNFFSAVQGKFDAKYHGRYIGNIIEQIAAIQNEIVEPLLKFAPTSSSWTLKAVEETTTESAYITDEDKTQDRRADLEVPLNSGERAGRILVEIKVKDNFLPNQLNDYINWAANRSDTEDRAVIVLTAFPIESKEKSTIEHNKKFIKHMYLSDFADTLHRKIEKSELIALFVDYLYTEGYAMYQLKSKNKINEDADESDYNALLSFMTMTFLPYNNGKGKVASAKKIARGPAIFSNIIQNWQLVSDRFSGVCLENKRRPTIRYFPDQATASSRNNFPEISDDNILTERKRTRIDKICGRYWLTADNVLDSDNKIRLEWGQIIQIQRGKNDATENIECYLFAYIRKNQIQIGGKIKRITNGIFNENLYNTERFMEEILNLAKEAKVQAIDKAPELKKFTRLK